LIAAQMLCRFYWLAGQCGCRRISREQRV